MKGLSWYLNRLLVLFFLIVFLVSVEAQGPSAEELLDTKEKELTRFVGVVEANARNCDALNGCSSVDGCSRSACYLYGTKGDRNYQCLDNVAHNSVCGLRCTQRNFDFSKGFVRQVDELNAHISRTVCTHRTLDDHFKNSSMNDSSHLFRVFFGAVDGTTRLYPGVDEDCDEVYDPRLRPWFLESTYVPKGVTLLIDSGRSMREKLTGAAQNGETYLTLTRNVTLKFLETLHEIDTQDYVNLICFDEDGITPSNANSQKYNKTLLYQSFKDTLDAIIHDTTGSMNDPTAASTSHAINTAILEMNHSVPISYLKVAIVLTTGHQFQNLSELKIAAGSGVNVFVYKFRTEDRDPKCNESIPALSEAIPVERLDNPLLILESYYSFLAKTHRKFMKNLTDYGQSYPDASGIDSTTLTISKAAFGPSGELLGVVGIDFFEKKVEEQYKPLKFDLIVEAARKHDLEEIFEASKYAIRICFNHTDVCSNLRNNYTVDGMCEKKNGDEKIGCCGQCEAKEKKKEWGKILGGIAAGIAGLAGIATLGYFAKRWASGTSQDNFVYSGTDSET